MNSTWLDALVAVVGVAIAPFLIQGIFKTRSTLGKVVKAAAGILIVIVFLYVWGRFGRDPLQIAYCSIDHSAPSCTKENPARRQQSALDNLAGVWRLPEDTDCSARNTIQVDGAYIRVTLYAVEFVERIDSENHDVVATTIVAPMQARGQRFEFRPFDDGSQVDVTPLASGQGQRWRRC